MITGRKSRDGATYWFSGEVSGHGHGWQSSGVPRDASP